MENQIAVVEPQKKTSLFSIKPYGNNLCTPGASYWISCIRLVIIVMALSEAIAWAYLGSLFGQGMVGYVAAGIAFLFVFIIIWVIDVSFVTLDMSKAHYDNEIMKKKSTSWVDTLKISTGLIGRVAIVVVSLSISAPFIAQIVFMQDIDNEMEGRNLARVAIVSDSLLAERDAEVAGLDSLILEKEQELIVETAGRGTSGNYGFGPVTQAMERNIQRLKDERNQKIAEKEEMQDAFASLTIEEFAQRYNVDLVDNGVQARSAILTSLSQNPEYKTAKRAITAFLAFIFAALVLLKLFQPRSVRIYYNEKLQDLYREYLSGNLNKWISKEEQLLEDGRSQISPLRFEDWSINTYGVIRNEDIKRRESSKMYNSFKLKIEQLESEKEEVKKMLDPIEAEYDTLVTELNGLRIEVIQADSAVEQNDRAVEDIKRQLETMFADLRNGSFKGQDLVHAVQAKKSMEDRLAQHTDMALQLKYDQDIATHRYDIKKEEVDQVEVLMAKVRANYRFIQEKIDDERLKYTELIVNGTILGGVFPIDSEKELNTNQITKADGQDVDFLEKPDNRAEVGHTVELHQHNIEQVTGREEGTADELQEDDEENVVASYEQEYVPLYEERNPFADTASQDFPYEEGVYTDELEYEEEKPESDDEMINQFIWEDEESVGDIDSENDPAVEQESVKLDGQMLTGSTEESSQEVTYQHYPLLLNGMEEEVENDEESPVEYVDNNQLKRYADSVSLAEYGNQAEFDIEQKDNENNVQNEEEKSGNSIEVISPHSIEDAPEEIDVKRPENYSEERNGEPVYFWDDLEAEAADSTSDNLKSERTTYAWDALESANPDQTETERDEIVEEGAEEEDQSANATDTGEAEVVEDITDDDEPEAPNSRARDPQPRRKMIIKRRLGRTGDWMIG